MYTLKYTNEENGLSATFSTSDPMNFIESFDGSSLGSTAVVYKPIEYDGQKFISANLNARTLRLCVNIGGKADGKYSRSAAVANRQNLQRIFVPGQYGKLEYTSGSGSRFIRCRLSEAPDYTEIMPFLFRAEMNLVADIPLWFDAEENVVPLSSGNSLVIDNDCGLAVPFILEVGHADVFAMYSTQAGAGIAFYTIGEGFTINTADCTVISASGELCNNLLSVSSEFFYLVPGKNNLTFSGSSRDVVLKWRKAYTGI